MHGRQFHNPGGGEGLRHGGQRIDDIGRRLELAFAIRPTKPFLPIDMAIAKHRDRHRRRACRDKLVANVVADRRIVGRGRRDLPHTGYRAVGCRANSGEFRAVGLGYHSYPSQQCEACQRAVQTSTSRPWRDRVACACVQSGQLGCSAQVRCVHFNPRTYIVCPARSVHQKATPRPIR